MQIVDFHQSNPGGVVNAPNDRSVEAGPKGPQERRLLVLRGS